jgi:hypothetical protein
METLDRRVRDSSKDFSARSQPSERPRVVFIIPRGEALRNFVYSRAVRELNRHASVTLLSITQDESTLGPFISDVDQVVPLLYEPYHPALQGLLNFIDLAHYRVLGTVVAKQFWERRREENLKFLAGLRRQLVNAAVKPFSNQRSLEFLTNRSQELAARGRGTVRFLDLLRQLRPALVFNGSHIHSPAAARPLAAAHKLGIPTAGFIFSWDNITSRGRITDHYDYYLVWHQRMRNELLRYYPSVSPDRVFITGTPQFDFHFKPEFTLSRAEICRRMGLDPARPFILYTTGVAGHFPEEHRTVELVAQCIQRMTPAPQLLVRTYIKGTSQEMSALAKQNLPGVVFPPVLWKSDALTPMYEDISIYSSLLRHCSLGINAASTVSLELMMFDKPVINLGFDPPGSALGRWSRFDRHLGLDHYIPVAESGAVKIARSSSDLETMIRDAFQNPGREADARRQFLQETFGETLDGNSAKRISDTIASLVLPESRF